LLKEIYQKLNTDFGMFKGDFFLEWIEKKLSVKLGLNHATFNDLHAKI
jgi:hypothetical protein